MKNIGLSIHSYENFETNNITILYDVISGKYCKMIYILNSLKDCDDNDIYENGKATFTDTVNEQLNKIMVPNKAITKLEDILKFLKVSYNKDDIKLELIKYYH